jgi:OOP family OmpA-OmpF porin
MKQLSYLLSILLILSAPLSAEIKPKSFSISPFIGKYYFDSAQHIESNATAGFGLAYHFTKNWATEFTYLYGEFNTRFYDAAYDDCCCCGIDSHMIHLDALYHFQPEKKWVPYLAAGPGYINLKYECGKKINESMFNYGGGIKYNISNDFSLRGDIRHIYTFDDSNNNLSITVGLTYQIGKKATKAPEPKPYIPPKLEPEPVKPIYVPPKMITDIVSIDLKIQFDLRKVSINPEYHEHIKEVAGFLKKYPDTKAVIEGHTCNLGSSDYNLKLSQKRAWSVCQYLIDNFGIHPERVQAVGYGETRPVADNTTEMGRKMNRRVIAVISAEVKRREE